MKELGIEPVLLVAQIINFAIIFFVLKKFLYKPLFSVIDKRKREIEEGLAMARKIQEDEEKAKEKQEKLIADAKKEARAIVEEAKKQAEQQKKQMLADAQKEVASMMEKAKAQAEAKMKAVEEEMRRQVVDLAALMAEKVLPDVLSEADHRKLIASQLKDLEKTMKKSVN